MTTNTEEKPEAASAGGKRSGRWTPKPQGRDIEAEITERLIGLMEAGTPPWQKPWSGGGGGMPLRHNGEPYSGINVLVLWSEAADKGHSSDHWMTFKQAQEYGGKVRKGEKSTAIIHAGVFEKENAEGEKERIPYKRTYAVFNASQIDGLPEKFHHRAPAVAASTERRADLDEYFAATGAKIEERGGQAAYFPIEDKITMPPIGNFTDTNRFYQVLSHEAVHWTGAGHRLDRGLGTRVKADYAREELVAEIGSAFLMARHGIRPDFEQSAAYLKGWAAACREDQKLIFKAAADASKAIRFINAAALDGGAKAAWKEEVFAAAPAAAKDRQTPAKTVLTPEQEQTRRAAMAQRVAQRGRGARAR